MRSIILSTCLLPTRYGSMRLDLHRVGDVEVPVLYNFPNDDIPRDDVPVRVHDACFTSEVLKSTRCDCDEQLCATMRELQTARGGMIMYMPQEGRGIGLANKVAAYHVQDKYDMDTYAANRHLGLEEDMRSYEEVAAILNTYGIRSIHLWSDSRTKLDRIRDANVVVTGTSPVVVAPTRHNAAYLRAKRRFAIHALPSPPPGSTPLEDAVRTLREGRPIVVTDDEDRENEGDLIIAAEHATPEWVAFFLEHTSGILCVALEAERASALRLPPMVEHNEDAHGTAFTVSVDLASSTTGISSVERARTIQALANETTVPTELRRPGHVFPLVARPGGLVERRGHTEASVTMCALAGVRPCALLSEIVTKDKLNMARGAELRAFASEFHLPMLTIDDIAGGGGRQCTKRTS